MISPLFCFYLINYYVLFLTLVFSYTVGTRPITVITTINTEHSAPPKLSQKPMSSLCVKFQPSSTPLLIDFDEAFSCSSHSSCDRGQTKSTPILKT